MVLLPRRRCGPTVAPRLQGGSVTVEIPVWLLWWLGIVGGVVLVSLAALGIYGFLQAIDDAIGRHLGW